MGWFPSPWRLAAKAGGAGVSAATIGLYLSERLRPFWKIGCAYLAVALGFLLTFIAGAALPAPDSLTGSPIIILTLSKLFDVAPLVLVMLLLPLLAGDSLAALYLQRGRSGQSLLLGLLVSAATFVPFVLLDGLEGARAAGMATVVAALPWIAVFALANSFMEELGWRGLFLRKFQAVLGAGGALLLTGLGWGLMQHDGQLLHRGPARALRGHRHPVGPGLWLDHPAHGHPVGRHPGACRRGFVSRAGHAVHPDEVGVKNRLLPGVW